MVTACCFAFMCTHTAFISHDAAHRQVFASAKKNAWLARIAGNLFVGLSYGWWMNKHGKHHLNPNKIGVDGDIDPGVIVFDPENAAKRTGFAKWFAAPPRVLLLPAADLGRTGSAHCLREARAWTASRLCRSARPRSPCCLSAWCCCRPSPSAFLGWGIGLAFIAVQIMALGLYMGGSFAPNHKGMPLVPKDVKIDFMRRQTLMSRNISGGWWVDAGMGGLNYQIEHHLFPTMSSRNLKAVQPMVREYCAERNITYTETTLGQSYMIVMRYLNRVGLGQRDPFECPITANMRTAR